MSSISLTNCPLKCSSKRGKILRRWVFRHPKTRLMHTQFQQKHLKVMGSSNFLQPGPLLLTFILSATCPVITWELPYRFTSLCFAEVFFFERLFAMELSQNETMTSRGKKQSTQMNHKGSCKCDCPTTSKPTHLNKINKSNKRCLKSMLSDCQACYGYGKKGRLWIPPQRSCQMGWFE